MELVPARRGVPLVAAGDVHYHVPERQALCDVLTAIRHGCTVAEAGEHLFPNAQRHLKSPEEMAALFADAPEAVRRTLEIAERVHVFARRVALRVSRGVGPAGRDAQRVSRPAHLGRGAAALSRAACRKRSGGCWSTSCN